MVKLFDIQNGKVIPTEHCYTLGTLKDIMDHYGQEEALKIYSYIFYMTCPNPDLNPFFDVPEVDKEDLILREVGSDFSTEDDLIIYAKNFCEKLYQTPAYRAYMGLKGALDKLAKYMETTDITDGRDGNITAIVNAAKNFEQVRQSFKGAMKDLQEEQSSIRGNQNLAYDDK